MPSHLIALLSPLRSPMISTAAPPSLLDQLRDIHPGPTLPAALPDPRWQGLLWLLVLLMTAAMLGLLLFAIWRHHRWDQVLTAEPPHLVSRVQTRLREEATQRWPDSRKLQGEAWLAFLDQQGGTDLRQFSPDWPRWLYGSQQPTATQAATLAQEYRRWGRRMLWRPRPFARHSRPPSGARR